MDGRLYSNFLIEACEMFDNKIALAQADFMEAIAIYAESSLNDDLLFTEKKKESETFVLKTKRFFANLIAAFQNFIATIQVEIDRKVRGSEFQKNLRKLHKELEEGKKNGIQTVEVHDIWNMRTEYLSCVKELKKYAKKFSEMKYKRTEQIDEDIIQFNTIMEDYKQKLEEASKKTVVVPISKMINFIESEVNGRSKVLNTLNEAIALLQQMSKDCELIEKRRDILGPDILTKHVGFIRRIAYNITGFFKKWVVKFISTVVFIFA